MSESDDAAEMFPDIRKTVERYSGVTFRGNVTAQNYVRDVNVLLASVSCRREDVATRLARAVLQAFFGTQGDGFKDMTCAGRAAAVKRAREILEQSR